jgi:hypothetical protein
MKVSSRPRQRIEDGVIGRIHVDLAAIGEALDPAHVPDQGQPPQPVRPVKAERVRHHRGATVGAHHQPAAHLPRRAVLVFHRHATHEAAVHDQPGHPVPLAHLHRQRARPLQQEAVEHLARDGEGVIAIPAPRSPGRVRPVQHGAVGRGDAHAVDGLRPRPVHRLQHVQAVEHPRRLGREILPADLRARERGLVEQGDRPASLGQQDGRRAPGGSPPDDHDVPHALTRTAQKRKYGQ